MSTTHIGIVVGFKLYAAFNMNEIEELIELWRFYIDTMFERKTMAI